MHVTKNSSHLIFLLLFLRDQRFQGRLEVCEGEGRCLRQYRIFDFHVCFRDLDLIVATFFQNCVCAEGLLFIKRCRGKQTHEKKVQGEMGWCWEE